MISHLFLHSSEFRFPALDPVLVYDLDKSQLTDLFSAWGQPAYRARQVWEGLYRHFYDSPDQFTALPKSLRQRMARELDFAPFQPHAVIDSRDGMTRKTALR